MLIKDAVFVTSSKSISGCPQSTLYEFAFIGRSNVGKSSLINMLTGNKRLAKTSSTPGKTQLINHFLINDTWHLVDLPGYGWAKVSKGKKLEWNKMIRQFILQRENLACTFVLVDSRHDPQSIDIEFINWLGSNGIPLALIFTKSDKQSKGKTQAKVSMFHKHLSDFWEVLPESFVSSAQSKEGQTEILGYIDRVIRDLKS